MADKMKKFQTPITAFYNGEYVKPGTEIEATEAEYRKITDIHGLWAGPSAAVLASIDPGNTNQSRVDAASIKTLNELSKNNGGTGEEFKPIGEDQGVSDDDEGDEELETMSKNDLIAYAELHKVPVNHAATKAEIIAVLKKSGK